MSVRGTPAPQFYQPGVYWEDRARRFSREGEGLAAVCAYGMPTFYNRAIDWEQRVALQRWLAVRPGSRVLDVGCGVGRWSRLLAARGALVTGVDLSPTMVAQARARAAAEGVADRCDFRVQDLSLLDVGAKFDLVLGVTVLQHILDADALHRAVRSLVRHLAPGGRMVLLEAAPTASVDRCDSTVFRARPRAEYLALFRGSGLKVEAVGGVDPAPFRSQLLPHVRRMPRVLALPLLGLVTAMSLPINLLAARRAANRSWHALFVLTPAGE
jgi:2-polyprenyl-3-methyl-5-hydroxy-6-metoxy-1,4-benzoquinol methylase